MTVVPSATSAFPAGDCSTTVPFGCSESTYRRATAKPAASSVDFADSYGCPITGGTATGSRPRDTLMRTRVPTSIFPPPFGDCAVTVSTGFSEKIGTTFASNPARASAATASSRDSPTTSGTSATGGPDDTVIATELPPSISSPPCGSCAKTNPSSTSGVRFALHVRHEPGVEDLCDGLLLAQVDQVRDGDRRAARDLVLDLLVDEEAHQRRADQQQQHEQPWPERPPRRGSSYS